MGIFGALTTSVAGLRAQSYGLENISGNIANSQTTAFKRIDTSFLDLVPHAGVNNQLAGSVTTQSHATNSVQGDVQSASVSTYMAINGDGFFVVQKPSGYSDNQPTFGGVDNYTRRGDFSLDKNGYLVNGAGYYLEGVPIDSSTGNPAGSVPQVLRFANDFLPAVPTSTLSYRANLAGDPHTPNFDKSVPGSGLLRPADFTGGNPFVAGTPASPFAAGSMTGSNAKDNATPPVDVTGATKLSGSPGGLATAFGAGDTITVNGQILTFKASGAAGANEINITDTVADLLLKIDALSGGTGSSVSAGAITFNSSAASDLAMTTSNNAAFTALGLPNTVKALRTGTGAAVGTGQVLGTDAQTFEKESLSGGATTAYDVSGAPVSLQLRWAKTDSASLGAGHSDTWNLFYQVDPNATGSQVAWQNVNVDFKFGPNGQMNPPISAITLASPTIGGVTLGNVTINFGAGGITQFADANGGVKINRIQQNGFPAGSLETVSIGENGKVVGNYSNGRNIDLAQISVATFNGADFLQRLDGGAFAATDQSGQALFGGGGTISGSSLESSNVDIADEFTKLIVTQQAYSSNTRVITTTNTMVQDLLNVLR